MKKFTPNDVAAFIVWLIPFAYLLYVYKSLPATVPMHYDARGEVDRLGSKIEFLFASSLMSVAGLVSYLVIRFLPSIDPKKKAQYAEGTYQKVAFGIIVFLVVLNLCIIFVTANAGIKLQNVIFPAVGLFFAFLGNMMHSIKPNYFVGIRTPWTLENEDTWRVTHQLAAKVWFVGGLIIAVVTLLLPDQYDTYFFLTAVLVMALTPAFYSYWYYTKKLKN